MPSKYRRIAITEDPDLASALRSAGKALPDLSDAALVKKLALIGAEVVASGSQNRHLEKIQSIPGARIPTRQIDPLLDEIALLPKLKSRDVDRILEEDRADRL